MQNTLLKVSRTITIAIIFTIGLANQSWAEDEAKLVGSITSLKGNVSIIRGEEVIVATKGMRLEESDIIKTGKDSTLGAVLRDDTTISLGEKSKVELEQFDFEPAEDLLGMTLRVVKGKLACLTGRIAKLSPDTFKVETPVSTVGVRGTKFIVEVN